MSAAREALTPDKWPAAAYQAWADEVGANRWDKQEQAIAFSAFIAGWYRRTGEGEDGFWRESPPPPTPPASVPDYVALGVQVGELVTVKQAQYGDAFGVAPKILALLYPDGVQPTDYDTLLAVVRILDKLKRVATQHESDTEEPFRDIAGYALLMLARKEAR